MKLLLRGPRNDNFGDLSMTVRSSGTCSLVLLAVRVVAFTTLLTCNPTSARSQRVEVSTHTRFTVNFISKGTGVDHKAEQRFSDYLKQFQKENKVVLDYKIEPWGKEGETNYIFDLKKLSQKQRKDLKGSLTGMFKKNKVKVDGSPSG